MLGIIISLIIGFKIYSKFFAKPKLETGVEIYMAPPRTGKSSLGAWLYLKFHKQYKVFCNYPVKGAIKLNPRQDFMVYMIQDAMIIIDEAWEDFGNRDFKNFIPRLQEFFKTHGHYHLRIIVLSQSWDDVDIKIRKLAAKIVILRKFPLGFVKTKDIIPRIDISEEGEIVYKYAWKHWLLGGHRWYCMWNARKIYDSWSHKDLPEKQWETWDFTKPDRVKRKWSFKRKKVVKHEEVVCVDDSSIGCMGTQNDGQEVVCDMSGDTDVLFL